MSGWTNIDLPSPRTFLAADRPDLVKLLATTDDDYYGKHASVTVDTLRDGPINQDMVCDIFGGLENIPVGYWSVSHFLLRQVFEHVSLAEAHVALDQIDGVMEPNGELIIDVPDHEETLRLYVETGDKFYVRHLLGPRSSDRGYHLVGYTKERLRALVEEHGFIFAGELPNIHVYPSICLRFVKPGPRAPRDYVTLPAIPDDWRVLEIGPGAYPLPRADVYLDRNIDNLTPLSAQGKSTIVGDIESGLPEIADKAYGYLFCSHVMEHCGQVQKCVDTLNRISANGTLVVPSAIKEGLFGGSEEAEHKWLIAKSPDGTPVFVRHNAKFMARLKDSELEKITGRLWRTGPNRNPEARYLRKFFYQHEADYDIVVHWTPKRPLKVIVVE